MLSTCRPFLSSGPCFHSTPVGHQHAILLRPGLEELYVAPRQDPVNSSAHTTVYSVPHCTALHCTHVTTLPLL
jgi:hypothetical protein